MNFLKDIALPQPIEHFHLLVLIAAMSSLALIPYVGFVLGSSGLSLFYNRRARKAEDRKHLAFAKSLIDNALRTKSLVVFLALIPGISVVFVYGQMLQGTPAIATGLAGFGFLFMAAGMVLLYSYKYTFRIQGVLESYLTGGEPPRGDIEHYRRTNLRAHMRSGYYGFTFLVVAVFLYGSAITVTASPQSWTDITSIFDVLLSGVAWLKFLEFIALAAGVTGAGILAIAVLTGTPLDALTRRVSLRLGVVSLVSLPAILVVNLTVLPGEALSGLAYGLPGAALALLFAAAHFLYGFFRTSDGRAVLAGSAAFLIAGMLIVAGDYAALGIATKHQAAALASLSDRLTEDVRAKLGFAVTVMTGEDIYNAKCSACHMFNMKKVGPPYNVVLKKYVGRKSAMVAFVMDRVKVDPAYPPMPNQALKPSEADSIVTYLLAKVSSAGARGDSTGAVR